MRVHLIANPESGTDRAVPMLPEITRRLRTRFADVDITLTTEAEDAVRAAGRAVEHGCAAIFVGGGDGTVNAVVRGLMGVPAAARPPVGILPLGTGNDFAKSVGLGEEVDVALERVLSEPMVVEVDVGLMNDRPFINTSAGGFIADVSEAVTPFLKDVAGKLAYLIGGARVLMTSEPVCARLYRPCGPEGSGRAPAADLRLQMFAICNARFIGGGYAIAPAAVIDDGLLDALVVPSRSLVEFAALLQRIAAGEPSNGDVLQFRASAFDLEFDRPIHVNVDGEAFETDRCRYRIEPRGARFFCGPEPQTVAPPRRWESP